MSSDRCNHIVAARPTSHRSPTTRAVRVKRSPGASLIALSMAIDGRRVPRAAASLDADQARELAAVLLRAAGAAEQAER